MGAPLGHAPGFAYSEPFRAKGGTWTWEAMNEWLRSPRAYIPGTKMTFAGLSDPQDRANVMAYLNANGSNLPLPPPPAAEAAPAGEAPAENGAGAADAPAGEQNATGAASPGNTAEPAN
jgi:cytochrome c